MTMDATAAPTPDRSKQPDTAKQAMERAAAFAKADDAEALMALSKTFPKLFQSLG